MAVRPWRERLGNSTSTGAWSSLTVNGNSNASSAGYGTGITVNGSYNATNGTDASGANVSAPATRRGWATAPG